MSATRDIERARELLAAVSPGPWLLKEGGEFESWVTRRGGGVRTETYRAKCPRQTIVARGYGIVASLALPLGTQSVSKADAEFITEARVLLPVLLAEIDRLNAEASA